MVSRAVVLAGALLAPSGPAWAAQEPPTYARAHAEVDAGRYAEAAVMLEELTKLQPNAGNAWQLLGYAYHVQKDYERALPAYLEAMKFPASAPHAYYNAACLHALKGDKDRAFQYLRQAEATGGIDLALMDGDADLESLRGDPRYAELRPPPDAFAETFVEPVRVLQEWRGEAALGQFGWIARNAGDVDGDGACDVVTSAPTLAAGGARAGRVYVYSSRTGQLLWQRTGQPGDQLGLGIEAAGDVDADGTPDVIAGAPGRGRAFVYSGADGAILRELEGQASEAFGQTVSDLGDLDGDGHADVLVGAPLGSAGGSAGAANAGHCAAYSGKSGELLLLFSGERAGDRFASVAAGWSDGEESWIVIGAPNAGEGQRGRVYVYDGEGATRFVIEAEPSGTELGDMFLSIVGDVDGDGVGDVYASDWGDGSLGASTGRIYVHSGATGARLWSAAGEAAGEGFGVGPADAGDIDGDGLADLVVGAWQHASGAPSGGRVTLLSGKDGAPLRAITCKVRGDTFGFDATGMGDVDGDGRIDMLLTSAWSGVSGTRSGRVFLIAGEALGGS